MLRYYIPHEFFFLVKIYHSCVFFFIFIYLSSLYIVSSRWMVRPTFGELSIMQINLPVTSHICIILLLWNWNSKYTVLHIFMQKPTVDELLFAAPMNELVWDLIYHADSCLVGKCIKINTHILKIIIVDNNYRVIWLIADLSLTVKLNTIL